MIRSCLLLGTLHAFALQAQNEEDVLRYSSDLPGGTARSWAMGGAVGAVGADPGASSVNPAGFGLYSKSEFSFSPSFEVNSVRSTWNGTDRMGTDNRFHIGNYAIVLATQGNGNSDWHGGAFGLSFDRQASFHWDHDARATNMRTSIADYFVTNAHGYRPSELMGQLPFTADLAYATGLIYSTGGDSLAYDSPIPYGDPMDQRHRVATSGRMNTTNVFYAANYKDRLYLGMSLGFSGIRYERNMRHAETAVYDDVELGELTYGEKLVTRGSGVNIKLGVIGRVGDRLRLGGSFHTPQWLRLNDSYSYSMDTRFRTPDSNGNYQYGLDSPEGQFSYRIRTPWRLVGSAAYVVGKNGLVTVDYVYGDQRQSRLSSTKDLDNTYDFDVENTAVRNVFRPVHSVRGGTEWRVGGVYLRGGAAWVQDAYAQGDPRQGGAYLRYTGGIGFRTERMSLDLGFMTGSRNSVYYAYNTPEALPIHARWNDARGMITLAFRP